MGKAHCASTDRQHRSLSDWLLTFDGITRQYILPPANLSKRNAMYPSMLEAITKVFRDDRHPLSVQLARNILRWLRDPLLVRKWQKVFVPHMQTVRLERLQAKSFNWLDRHLIGQELATRHQLRK